MESYKVLSETGKLPKKLRYKGRREFFDGQERPVSVRSKIKTVAPGVRP